MAGASLLALIDDIATLLDDVSVMTKVAAKKTAGVLGDDLALNAQQVTGVQADRELPVVWAVAKGSLLNKAMLVPLALVISAWAAWAITPLLMLGGLFLCFEGAEKLWHAIGARRDADEQHRVALREAVRNTETDLLAFERQKIKGAVRTDFILSAEIIVISLGTVASAPIGQRILVLVGIALLMTVGVYGLVAGIVKLDDLGLYLSRQASNARQALGRAILAVAPWLMKSLSVLGTAAMFLVGGGILVHGIPMLGHAIDSWAQGAGAAASGVSALLAALLAAVLGVVAGAGVLALVSLSQRLWGRKPPA